MRAGPALTLIRIIFLLILGLLFLALVLPIVSWQLKPVSFLDAVIIDKTVPYSDYREHRGLMWVLNHEKFFNAETGEAFDFRKDYYGFFPLAEEEYYTSEYKGGEERPDLIYLVDTYGVYEGDYSLDDLRGEPSERIYGGLEKEELAAIKNQLQDGMLIIGEFNTMASPTSFLVKEELEDIFGLSWSGWIGRYYFDLTRGMEVPFWVISQYERGNRRRWNFGGEGFVFISEEKGIIVLEKKHLADTRLIMEFKEEWHDYYGVRGEIPYYYWFEILETGNNAETLAEYSFSLNEEGKKILQSAGIPESFPAFIKNERMIYRSYYFAGDFADNSQVSGTERIDGLPWLKSKLSFDIKGDTEAFFWRAYVPLLRTILRELNEVKKPIFERPQAYQDQGTKLYTRTKGQGFQIYKEDEWQNVTIKGINIGAALPGRWFTEFPKGIEIYYDWFRGIQEMEANTLRIYTLLPPDFYRALYLFNQENKDKPLYLFQEIWPEEHPPGDDYLREEYQREYEQEIRYAVDAIHGKANIPERRGRAYGIYNFDVSPYLIGYLVGRELEPWEVETTDRLNPGFSYQGEYLRTLPGASATEGWLAMNCDYVLSYQEEKYGVQHPVAIVSWPTLDYLEHDSEWNEAGDKSKQYNDWQVVDINNIELGERMKAGFFGAYHIYPNYPDFMNNEQKYRYYEDEQGRLMYGGYLREFIERHRKYPALVAEFGLATGTGNAHFNPDGYHHGGMTEREQGEGVVRMMRAILNEGYAGGLIFQWMDEWAKKTWTTEPYMIPYDRHAAWHNVNDPEQNYGILANENTEPRGKGLSFAGVRGIEEMELNHNEAYLFIDIYLAEEFDPQKQELRLGFDVHERDRGDFLYSPNLQRRAPSGMEFMLIVDAGGAKLLAHPEYAFTDKKFAPAVTLNGEYIELLRLVNRAVVTKSGEKIEELFFNESVLEYGEFKENKYTWFREGNLFKFRIPWSKLNIADPSSLSVIFDERENIPGDLERDYLRTESMEGIIVSPILIEKETNRVAGALQERNREKLLYTWEGWNLPLYEQRFKESYRIIREYFAGID